MPQDFFSRLVKYFQRVSEALRGEADALMVFPNPADIGSSREGIYAAFLRQHVPSKCNVLFGGFLFQVDGTESGQLDVIITTDTTPRFEFVNRTGHGKSFSALEGALAVATIKSSFEKQDIYDSLNNIASIPPMQPLGNRFPHNLKALNQDDYADWPYKIVFAYRGGISAERIHQHILHFYEQRPDIPIGRKPNIIHVAGTCMVFRMAKGYLSSNKYTNVTKETQLGDFELITTEPDLQAIPIVLQNIQKNALLSTHMMFNHDYMLDRVIEKAF